MDAKQMSYGSNHADMFHPLFMMRACSHDHVMHVTTREYEHIVNFNAGYWHSTQYGYMVANRATFIISKNGVPFTQADIDKISPMNI
jgi:hypothetical protein